MHTGGAPQGCAGVAWLMRAILLLLCLLLPGVARADGVLAAVAGERWAEAEALAAGMADPVARKLVLYYRLLTPGAARSTEIAAFMAANPDWPQQGALSRRLAEALLVDKDDRAVLEICQRRPPSAVPSLLRCADAAVRSGASPDADARRAWLLGITDAPAEAAFMKQWGRVLTAEDQWRRFDRLAWTDSGAPGGPASRQAMRLDASSRPAAEARLALRRDDPVAPALANVLTEPARSDPALVLDLARWYRRAGLDRDAARIWTERGEAAEQAAPAERQQAFWDERNLLARRLLRAHEDLWAYGVVKAQAASAEARLDAEFLAGWIALRRLDRPDLALEHFQTLAGRSRSAITQGRAGYWVGRALAASGDAEGSRASLAQAARWATTFYGQLAALALGEGDAGVANRIHAAADPAWTAEQALDFAGRDVARAAALLAVWGEPRRAKAFLARLDELADEPYGRALAARLAVGLGLPEQAVATARRAGRDGVMMPVAGWPDAADPPPGPVERAVAMALIRQESSFDVQALSPAGARGLMQLMPATAASVARKLNEPASAAALTTDAGFNMRLGTAYLQGLLEQFGGALPMALAAYNAGPSRVLDWSIANGDPLAGAVDIVDWIELIPFNETRNYVQRVIENVVIYRAQHGGPAPHPLARWQG